MTPCYIFEPNQSAQIVTEDELENSLFIADVLNYAQGLQITSDEWREYLTNEYTLLNTCIIDTKGNELFLDMEVFEIDDDLLFAANDNKDADEEIKKANKAIINWFEHWLCKPTPKFTSNLTKLDKERLKVVATILRAANPQRAIMWGIQGKAANDNKE